VNEGVDVERIVGLPTADVHEECYLPVGSPVVGNVAALVPHKGQHYLIEAAALVVREVPDVRFVILGTANCASSSNARSSRSTSSGTCSWPASAATRSS
jgi:glycosyltransferase involved in cell wall biosynthesis